MNQVLSKVSFQIDITSRLKIARALTNARGERIDFDLTRTQPEIPSCPAEGGA